MTSRKRRASGTDAGAGKHKRPKTKTPAATEPMIAEAPAAEHQLAEPVDPADQGQAERDDIQRAL